MTRLTCLLAVPLAASALTGCLDGGERAKSGECPAGEVCSNRTPNGLHFRGNQLADEVLRISGPRATAIGGTQEVELEYDPGSGYVIPLGLAYAADDDGGLGITVEGTDGPVVSIRGVASRRNYLRIIEPQTGELYDRYELAGAAITAIRPIPVDYEELPASQPDLVWATGDQRLGIALLGEVQVGSGPQLQRLVDSSMVLSMPSATQSGWDELMVQAALAGVHTIAVTAGDPPGTTIPIEFVADADELVLISDPTPTVAPGGSTQVCFAAMHGARYVAGLTWQYNVDGEASTRGAGAYARNCVGVGAGTKTSGTIAVAVATAGLQTNVTVVVGGSARTRAEHVPTTALPVRRATPLGERATLVED